jgi:hypothetical protein
MKEDSMAIRQLPDPAILRKVLRYEPDTGKLFWLPRTPDLFSHARHGQEWACKVWNTKNAGNEALRNPHGKSHYSGNVFGEVHLAHRVAWAIHFGQSDFGMIDHIDGNGRNNQISNLRLASRQINSQNARMRHDCSSGITGVHRHINKRWGLPKWTARIQVGKRRLFLGSFETLEEAKAARRAAELKYGFGPSHGKVRL